MKDFIKMLLAVLAGMLLFSVVWVLLVFSIIGSMAALSSGTPVVAKEGVLYMNMADFTISERENPMDVNALMQGSMRESLSLLNAVTAVKMAAGDPGIKFLYMRPDGVSAGIAEIEELRRAIVGFRRSGKAVVAYTENPSNAGYYLASAADKVYMTASKGGMNSLIGISSQMFFLKDLLDRLGVNMQLIRHGKYKSAGEMYIKNQISGENYEQTQAMVSSIWNSWAEEMAASRNISVEALNRMVDNLELVEPEDFLKNGLADELLTREQRKDKLAALYMAEDFDDVTFIPFADYVAARTAVQPFKADQIAIIYADGEIVDGVSEEASVVAGDSFAETIASVRENDLVKAVVLRVNSPGGSVLASDKIRKEIALLKETKPVIASYGNYAASGGYWISAGCDYVYSDATTLTGSIGVFSMIPEFSKTYRDIAHVGTANVNSNRHSDMYSASRPLDAAETAYLQSSVEHIYDEFTSLVAEGRDLRKTYVDSIAQGRVWAGADAIKIGLVDEIGGLEDALMKAASEVDGSTGLDGFYITSYPAVKTPWESLLASIQGSKKPLIFAGTPFEAVEKAFAGIDMNADGKVYARMPYEYIIK